MEISPHHQQPDLPTDVLHGAKQIAIFLFGSESRADLRKVYYLSESKQLPVFRLSRTGLCARRSTIRTWIERQEGGEAKAA